MCMNKGMEILCYIKEKGRNRGCTGPLFHEKKKRKKKEKKKKKGRKREKKEDKEKKERREKEFLSLLSSCFEYEFHFSFYKSFTFSLHFLSLKFSLYRLILSLDRFLSLEVISFRLA